MNEITINKILLSIEKGLNEAFKCAKYSIGDLVKIKNSNLTGIIDNITRVKSGSKSRMQYFIKLNNGKIKKLYSYEIEPNIKYDMSTSIDSLSTNHIKNTIDINIDNEKEKEKIENLNWWDVVKPKRVGREYLSNEKEEMIQICKILDNIGNYNYIHYKNFINIQRNKYGDEGFLKEAVKWKKSNKLNCQDASGYIWYARDRGRDAYKVIDGKGDKIEKGFDIYIYYLRVYPDHGKDYDHYYAIGQNCAYSDYDHYGHADKCYNPYYGYGFFKTYSDAKNAARYLILTNPKKYKSDYAWDKD